MRCQSKTRSPKPPLRGNLSCAYPAGRLDGAPEPLALIVAACTPVDADRGLEGRSKIKTWEQLFFSTASPNGREQAVARGMLSSIFKYIQVSTCRIIIPSPRSCDVKGKRGVPNLRFAGISHAPTLLSHSTTRRECSSSSKTSVDAPTG